MKGNVSAVPVTTAMENRRRLRSSGERSARAPRFSTRSSSARSDPVRVAVAITDLLGELAGGRASEDGR